MTRSSTFSKEPCGQPTVMTDSDLPHVHEYDCPTLQNLNVNASRINVTSPQEQANMWLSAFEASILNEDMTSLMSLFHHDGFWKDILALTWDLRTIRGRTFIMRMLSARLATTALSAFHLIEDAVRGPTIIRPMNDLVFVHFCFEFETAHGRGIAVAFLVPTSEDTWVAWSLLTQLHALKAHPEMIGALRAQPTGAPCENWEDRRRREIDFEDGDPAVLIIGAGHSGLVTAARLTYLGVPVLVIERNKRLGDNWRTRYKTMHLNTPMWLNRLPYLDYPPTWPEYCHTSKFGDWLEFYATTLDLNVWVSSSVTSTRFDEVEKTWQVSINRDGRARTMVVKHLVFATGFGSGCPKMPDIPRKELYCGSILHSIDFISGSGYEGKKVIIVGTGSSGHDIALALCRSGCDVTIIQRSPSYVISRKAFVLGVADKYNDHFPVDFADLLGLALPLATRKHLLRESVARVANGIDKELRDNLATAGFQTSLGPEGGGIPYLILQQGGGGHIDTGVSKEIINGNIKVKSGFSIRNFTEGGVELEDGMILEGDVVVFATGYGNFGGSIKDVCGPDVAKKAGEVYRLDVEGELQGVWRRTGHPRLWYAMSNPNRARLHSLYLALQIKAIEEGIVDDEIICTE